MKYQSRLHFVEAFQLTKKARRSQEGWPQWMLDAVEYDSLQGSEKTVTLEVNGYLKPVGFTDWIVCDAHGGLDVMTDEQFDHLYEKVKG